MGLSWGTLQPGEGQALPPTLPAHRAPLGQALFVLSPAPYGLVAGGFLPARCRGSGAHTKSPDRQTVMQQAGGKKTQFFFSTF